MAQEYQYVVVAVSWQDDKAATARLNAVAVEGWRLVAVTAQYQTGPLKYDKIVPSRAIFERRIGA